MLRTTKELKQLNCLKSLKLDLADVVFFWPSRQRSTGRFYAYKIERKTKPKVAEYWKIATTDEEKRLLDCESENTALAAKFANGIFKVAAFLGKIESSEACIFRYESLPDDAVDLTCSHQNLTIVTKACEQIREAGYQHRDFTLHNCKTSGDDLWVLDWESMRELSPETPSMMDEISFWLCREHYVARRNIKELSMDFQEKYLTGAMGMGENAYESLKALAQNKFMLAQKVYAMLS